MNPDCSAGTTGFEQTAPALYRRVTVNDAGSRFCDTLFMPDTYGRAPEMSADMKKCPLADMEMPVRGQ